MRRVPQPKASLLVELENLLDPYQWARQSVLRKMGVSKEAVALLRRAVLWNSVSMTQFRRATGLPKYAVTRAYRVLYRPKSAPEREWTKCSKRGKENVVTPTPAGVAFLKQLDKEVKRKLLAQLGLKARSERVEEFANALEDLTYMVERMTPKQLRLMRARAE